MVGARKDNRTLVIGAIGIAALICIIVIFYVIIGVVNKGPSMFNKNENTKEYTDRDLARIEEAVRHTLSERYGYSESEINRLKITMRKSELTVLNDDRRKLDFLIDVNGIGLTYRGALLSGQDGSEVYLSCPNIEEMQDKDFFCIGSHEGSSVSVILGDRLPYTGLINDEVVTTISVDANDSEASLAADVSLCNVRSTPADDTIRDFVKDWIRSVTDVDANIFPININYYDCEGKLINDD